MVSSDDAFLDVVLPPPALPSSASGDAMHFMNPIARNTGRKMARLYATETPKVSSNGAGVTQSGLTKE